MPIFCVCFSGRTLCVRIASSRYKTGIILIVLMSAWVTVHVTRGVLQYHTNNALRTREYEAVKEMSARDFIEHRERQAIDYHYGDMEGELDEVDNTHAQVGIGSTTEKSTVDVDSGWANDSSFNYDETVLDDKNVGMPDSDSAQTNLTQIRAIDTQRQDYYDIVKGQEDTDVIDTNDGSTTTYTESPAT